MTLRAAALLAILLAGVPAAYAGNNADSIVPPDTPERFMDRYGVFIRKDERRALKEADKPVRDIDKKLREVSKKLANGKLKASEADTQRAALEALKAPLLTQLETLITAFWTVRDPDPATPVNEEKKRIDELISDIETERFFSTTEAPGLMFGSHGGYYGDMAKVYLLHGPPDVLTAVQGNLFVPLMLWIYVDETRGNILYAFLFAETGFGPPYKLHSPEVYQMDSCGAINAIAQNRTTSYIPGHDGCPAELTLVYNELVNSMPSGYGTGYIFTWALTNFSQDPTVHQGDALEAPVPAAKLAKSSGSTVVGETPAIVPEPSVQTVLADCSHCLSMIPATLENPGPGTRILVTRKYVDWTVAGDELQAQMTLLTVVEGPTPKPTLLNKIVKLRTTRELLTETATRLTIPLFKAGDLDALPPGTYRVSVYLKGSLRNRYNAWVFTFTK